MPIPPLSISYVRAVIVGAFCHTYAALTVTRAELLDAALEAVGGDEFELARRLDLSLPNATRQFYRWRRGEGMNFETTIQLLEIAGLLSPSLSG